MNTEERFSAISESKITLMEYKGRLDWRGFQDRLIQQAARETKSGASDLLPLLEEIEEDLETGRQKPCGYYFGFWVYGVDSKHNIMPYYEDGLHCLIYGQSLGEERYSAVWRIKTEISPGNTAISLQRLRFRCCM